MAYATSDLRAAKHILLDGRKNKPARCRSHRNKILWKRVWSLTNREQPKEGWTDFFRQVKERPRNKSKVRPR